MIEPKPTEYVLEKDDFKVRIVGDNPFVIMNESWHLDRAEAHTLAEATEIANHMLDALIELGRLQDQMTRIEKAWSNAPAKAVTVPQP